MIGVTIQVNTVKHLVYGIQGVLHAGSGRRQGSHTAVIDRFTLFTYLFLLEPKSTL